MQVVIGLLVVFTPAALGLAVVIRGMAVLIALAIAAEIIILARAHPVSLHVTVLTLLIWAVAPAALALHLDPLVYRDIYTMVLLSDAYQFAGGALLSLGQWTPKPFPGLSPNKSLGGYLFAMALSGIVNTLVIRWPLLGTEGVLVLGFAGDLAESYVKRCMKVKDSSNWLSSHGGFLDRFDGTNFAVTFYGLAQLVLHSDLTRFGSTPPR